MKDTNARFFARTRDLPIASSEFDNRKERIANVTVLGPNSPANVEAGSGAAILLGVS